MLKWKRTARSDAIRRSDLATCTNARLVGIGTLADTVSTGLVSKMARLRVNSLAGERRGNAPRVERR